MIKNDLSSLIEDLVSKQGFFVVELQHSVSRGRDLLKIFVDNRDGVTLNDCVKISRLLEEEIEKTTKTFSLNKKNQESNLIDALKITCRKYSKEKTGKKPITNINLVRI